MLPETADRRELLRVAARSLPGDTPRLDAELLLADILGEPRLRMLMQEAPVSESQRQAFAVLLQRRQNHEPIAYILGRQEFWSLPLRVSPDVLIPRADSETLIAAAAEHFAKIGKAPVRILDLGTGSGALLLAALSQWPAASGLGIDQSMAALDVARQNACDLGLAGRAEFQQGDWADGLDERFDLLLCNPPYVRADEKLMPDVADFEPASALYAGADGLDCYRRILPQVAGLLQPGGIALLEFGIDQEQALMDLARANRLRGMVHQDLAGLPRALQLWPA